MHNGDGRSTTTVPVHNQCQKGKSGKRRAAMKRSETAEGTDRDQGTVLKHCWMDMENAVDAFVGM